MAACSSSPVQEGVVSLFYLWCFSLRVGVRGEASSVAFALCSWDVWSSELSVEELRPAQFLEKSVSFDVVDSILQVSISLGEISLQNVLYE